MRIGLYGLPTSGKNYILEKIDFINVHFGSLEILKYDKDFKLKIKEEKDTIRIKFAKDMMKYDDFIMDGHYAFGDEIAFTEADGELYDVIIYLFVPEEILIERMSKSERNKKYLKFNIGDWQKQEIEELREYCHKHNKDFFVIDNPDDGIVDADVALAFIKDVVNGFSCVNFAREVVDKLSFSSKNITLIDGDKTFIVEDTSKTLFGYKTNKFDNNLYTGYQSWSQYPDYNQYSNYSFDESIFEKIHIRERFRHLKNNAVLITAGYSKVWSWIANYEGLPIIYGREMSSEAKYYIMKFLKDKGYHITAFGDGMVDYYMVKYADEGYLFTKKDGTMSRSLMNKDLGGINIVRD